ncbi:MAG: Uma2 family endonuclease [Myxococcota bacterium]
MCYVTAMTALDPSSSPESSPADGKRNIGFRETPNRPPNHAVSIVTLENATWSDYQRLLELRGEKSIPRIAYLEGRMFLMSPSRFHETIASVTGRLVEAWCMDRNIDLTPVGSWTLEKKEAQRGAEPDECYVFGDFEDPERPDLAIEVIWTSGNLSKLDIYRKLDVPEVWVWRSGGFSVFVLKGENYEHRERSQALPELDLEQLAKFAEVRPMTRAVREFRAAVAGGKT